jgi:predicted aspartyl protease
LEPRRKATVRGLLVGTGSEHTWIPAAVLKRLRVKPQKKDVAFVMANGKTITRTIGFAVLRIGECFTID